MNEIPNILDKKEKVLWEGKPKNAPFIISVILGGLVTGGILGIISSIFTNWILGIIVGLILFTIILVFGILNYNFTHYALTDRRAIYQSGIFGRSYRSVNYDDIKNASLVRGLFNWMFNTGTIRVFTGEMQSTGGDHPQIVPKYDNFVYVDDADNILKKLQSHLTNMEENLYGGKNVVRRVKVVK